MEKVVIQVEGMSCIHCERAVNRALLELPGVESAEASHVGKNVIVGYDGAQVSLASMKQAIESEGYQVVG